MCKNSGTALKFMIFAFDAILFLLGICLAAVAGYTAFNPGSVLHNIIVSTQLKGALTGLYILMAVGIVMGIVAILGCVGATNENRLLLWLDFFFVLLLFIVLLVAVILCFYKFKVVEKDIADTTKLSARMVKEGTQDDGSADFLRTVLGKIERQMQCCGLNGPQDYGPYIPRTCRRPSNSTKAAVKKDQDSGSGVGLPGEEGEFKELGPIKKFKMTTTATMATTTTATPLPPTTTTMATTTTATSLPPTTTTMATTTTATPLPPATTLTTENITEHTSPVISVPATTQRMKTSTLTAKTGSHSRTYTTGCINFLKPIVYAAGGIGIAVLVLELLLLIFTGMLLCQIGKDYEPLA